MTKSRFGQNIRKDVIEHPGAGAGRDPSKRGNPFDWLQQFVKRQIIDEAPEDFAICEFDCRRGQCKQDELDACERRMRKGAGELFPSSRKP